MLAEECSWILDSGCTAHLCGDASLFKEISENVKGKINLANQSSSQIAEKGTVKLTVVDEQSPRYVEFHDTLYVPEIRSNLVSVAKIAGQGYTFTFKKNMAVVANSDGVVKLRAERRRDLYYVASSVATVGVAVVGVAKEGVQSVIQKWHWRLGHLNAKDLLKFINSIVSKQYKLSDAECLSKCQICLKGKMTILPFEKSERQTTEALDIIHPDVVGPLRTQGFNGAKYFVTFVDDHLRWCEMYFLKQKNGVCEAFELYKSKVERETGRKINVSDPIMARNIVMRSSIIYLQDGR